MSERRCSNCGNSFSTEGSFCPFCGTKAETFVPDEIGATVAVTPEQQAEMPAYQQPVYQAPAYSQPVYQQPVYQQPAYQQSGQQQYGQPAYQQPVYQQAAYQQPVYQQQSYAAPQSQPQPPQPPRKPKKKTGKIIGLTIGGIAAFLVIAAVLIFILTPGDSNTGIFENICKGNLFGGESGTGHSYSEATCEAPETCEYCSATIGKPLKHDWQDATCEVPETCADCGATQGKELGHDWLSATCEAPETCSVCGDTQGEAAGHEWIEATYEDPQICSLCSQVGELPLSVSMVLGDWTVDFYILEGSEYSGSQFPGSIVFNEDNTGTITININGKNTLDFTWEYSGYDSEMVYYSLTAGDELPAGIIIEPGELNGYMVLYLYESTGIFFVR